MDDEQSLSDVMKGVYGVYSVQSFDNNDLKKKYDKEKELQT